MYGTGFDKKDTVNFGRPAASYKREKCSYTKVPTQNTLQAFFNKLHASHFRILALCTDIIIYILLGHIQIHFWAETPRAFGWQLIWFRPGNYKTTILTDKCLVQAPPDKIGTRSRQKPHSRWTHVAMCLASCAHVSHNPHVLEKEEMKTLHN